jgi:dTDP-4-amino-4,6-dideoxy-D-galactose acyltransferase
MIRKLEWDSEFLGARVGAIDYKNQEFDFGSLAASFDLIYFFADEPFEFSKEFIEYFSVSLTDEKITYYKKLSHSAAPDKSIRMLEKEFIASEQVISIAIQSGAFSRFNVDQLFPDEKFKELYRLWCVNSINRKIAEQVFVYEFEKNIAGLITVGSKNGIPDIGLLAVNDGYRGRGIGHKLVAAVEHWSINEKKINELQVVTQAANLPACMFYEKKGFHLQQKQYVYHCWKK